MDVEDKMKRLEEARKKAEKIASEKARLDGQIQSKQNRLQELEDNAKQKFGCEISELPDKAKELDEESTEALQKAERLLGVESAESDAKEEAE